MQTIVVCLSIISVMLLGTAVHAMQGIRGALQTQGHPAHPLPVRMPVKALLSRLYWPNMKPTSRGPTLMSPAGTSVFSPMWRDSSVMNAWQKRITCSSTLGQAESAMSEA
jgi:hypothetical protein